MAKSLLVYIAGPYTAPDESGHETNTQRAIDAGIEVFRRGHFPYIPHLTHYVDMHAKRRGIKLDWADYIEWDLPWLDMCDALLYLGASKGADLELNRARELGKRIFLALSEVPRVKRRKSPNRDVSSKLK
jgi:Domain of unknown function (DUF4406)